MMKTMWVDGKLKRPLLSDDDTTDDMVMAGPQTPPRTPPPRPPPSRVNMIERMLERRRQQLPQLRPQRPQQLHLHQLSKPSDLFVYAGLPGLPDDGWIQGCICCLEPTTRMEKLSNHDTYICGKCSKLSNDKKHSVLKLFI